MNSVDVFVIGLQMVLFIKFSIKLYFAHNKLVIAINSFGMGLNIMSIIGIVLKNIYMGG